MIVLINFLVQHKADDGKIDKMGKYFSGEYIFVCAGLDVLFLWVGVGVQHAVIIGDFPVFCHLERLGRSFGLGNGIHVFLEWNVARMVFGEFDSAINIE